MMNHLVIIVVRMETDSCRCYMIPQWAEISKNIVEGIGCMGEYRKICCTRAIP